MEVLFVFLGGAFGALFRYLILNIFKEYPINLIGVFLVNMLGCFIIGFVSYIGIKKYSIMDKNLKNFFTVGFAGGFTTFSAFTHPVIEMFFKQHYIYVCVNMLISVILGLFFVAWGMNFGYYIMNMLIRARIIKYRQDY